MPRRFMIYRPVSKTSSLEIFDVAHEVLADADFIKIIGKDLLHLTLLSQNMLKQGEAPRSFLPYYEIFDSRRKDFVSRDTVAWEAADIKRIGARGIANALVINTERPEWLSRERNAARTASCIPSEKMALKKGEYNPHVTVGKFIGTRTDWDGFYECEEQLKKAWAETEVISLDPLRLECGKINWEFQKKTRPDQITTDVAPVHIPERSTT